MTTNNNVDKKVDAILRQIDMMEREIARLGSDPRAAELVREVDGLRAHVQLQFAEADELAPLVSVAAVGAHQSQPVAAAGESYASFSFVFLHVNNSLPGRCQPQGRARPGSSLPARLRPTIRLRPTVNVDWICASRSDSRRRLSSFMQRQRSATRAR